MKRLILVLFSVTLLLGQNVSKQVTEGFQAFSRLKFYNSQQDKTGMETEIAELEYLVKSMQSIIAGAPQLEELQKANILVADLVSNAEIYFWTRPRVDTIARIKSGDVEQIQYLVDSYLTRIYKPYHVEAIEKLEQLIKLLGE